MEGYQAYPEYKDSGVEWLDIIPSHWTPASLKMLVDVRDGTHDTPEYVETAINTYPLVTSKDVTSGKLQFDLCKHISEQDYLQIIKRSMVNVGDVLMPMIGTVGFPVVVKNDCQFAIKNLALFKTANSKKIDTSFLNYFLQSQECDIQFSLESRGGVQNFVSLGTLRDLGFSNPPILEQRKIANFLDHETAKIDTLIENQQQLIQLLKEKRQAVISHAVTKGLNPNAPMKDSGVEWLGEVPEHWEILPLKHTCALIKDGTHLPPPRVDIGIPLLSVRNIIDGKFVFREDDSNISEYDFEVLCKSFIPAINDVVLAIVGATLGKVALIESMAPFHVQRSVAIFRTKQKKLLPLTLKNIFDSRGFQSLLWEYVGFSAQPGIYLGTLENFQIAVAPADEQLQINAYCSTQAHAIDLLIDRGQKAIALMQERRTALISAAVTGKIDVRDWQAPQN